jgi:hypothetical protein
VTLELPLFHLPLLLSRPGAAGIVAAVFALAALAANAMNSSLP